MANKNNKHRDSRIKDASDDYIVCRKCGDNSVGKGDRFQFMMAHWKACRLGEHTIQDLFEWKKNNERLDK